MLIYALLCGLGLKSPVAHRRWSGVRQTVVSFGSRPTEGSPEGRRRGAPLGCWGLWRSKAPDLPARRNAHQNPRRSRIKPCLLHDEVSSNSLRSGTRGLQGTAQDPSLARSAGETAGSPPSQQAKTPIDKSPLPARQNALQNHGLAA